MHSFSVYATAWAGTGEAKLRAYQVKAKYNIKVINQETK